MNQPKHIVAIDLGSNSFHMVIAKEHQGRLTIVDRCKQRVRLSTGLDQDNVLSEQAIVRGVECLREFARRFSRLPHSAVRIVATQSLRKAVNRDAFIKAAFKVLPYPIEVIDGHTEAELIYFGVAHTQPLRQRTLVIDIGGGSTELIIGRHFEPSLKESLDLGSGQLRNKFFTHGDISQLAFNQAYDFARVQLSTVADRYRKYGWKSALGTSGSIKAVQQVLKELNGSSNITRKRLRRLKKQLISWGAVDSIPLPNINPEKLDILPSAVAILLASFDMLALDELDYCSGALREGVLYGLSESRTDSDIQQQTLNSMIKLYHTDTSYSHRVVAQLAIFSQQLIATPSKLTKEEFHCLTWAAQLHEIGLNINSKKRQEHGAYIIKHSEMLGFNQTEQEIIALLVKNHRGNIVVSSLPENYANKRVMFLVSLLRIAIICTQGRLNLPALPIKLSYCAKVMKLTVECNELINNKSGLGQALKEEQQRLIDGELTLDFEQEKSVVA